jgi:hypothetical protein
MIQYFLLLLIIIVLSSGIAHSSAFGFRVVWKRRGQNNVNGAA